MAVLASIPLPPVESHPRDRDPFQVCYEGHRDRVYRLCLRYGAGNASWAEDVAHDVFVKLLEHLPRLTDLEDIGAWLYRVATNESLSRLRRDQSLFGRMRQLLVGEAPNAPGPDVLYELRESAAAAVATLRALPPRERVVLCMKLLDGKSQKEIAETVSMSEGYVSKLLARAWARIRASGWEVDDAQA